MFISEVGDNVTRLVTKLVLLSFLKPNSFIGLFVWSFFLMGQIDLSDYDDSFLLDCK